MAGKRPTMNAGSRFENLSLGPMESLLREWLDLSQISNDGKIVGSDPGLMTAHDLDGVHFQLGVHEQVIDREQWISRRISAKAGSRTDESPDVAQFLCE